jgi:hypothetical protein
MTSIWADTNAAVGSPRELLQAADEPESVPALLQVLGQWRFDGDGLL